MEGDEGWLELGPVERTLQKEGKIRKTVELDVTSFPKDPDQRA